MPDTEIRYIQPQSEPVYNLQLSISERTVLIHMLMLYKDFPQYFSEAINVNIPNHDRMAYHDILNKLLSYVAPDQHDTYVSIPGKVNDAGLVIGDTITDITVNISPVMKTITAERFQIIQFLYTFNDRHFDFGGHHLAYHQMKNFETYIIYENCMPLEPGYMDFNNYLVQRAIVDENFQQHHNEQ